MKPPKLLIIVFIFLIFQNGYTQIRDLLDSIIIQKGASWSYYDIGDLKDTYWIEKQFLPPTWKKGKAPFGYNMNDISTTISYGNDSLNKNITSYFHKTFYLDNVEKFYVYQLDLRRDDGAIVYLNGREIWRTNMPFSLKENQTALRIIEKQEEKKFQTKILFPNSFYKGLNIIAIELYQRGKKTSDAVFDLQLKGSNNLTYLNDLFKYQNVQNNDLKEEVKDLKSKIELEKIQAELSQIKIRYDFINFGFYTFLTLLILSISLNYWLYRLKIKSTKDYKTSLNSLIKEVSGTKEELLNQSLKSIQNNQSIELVKDEISKVAAKPSISNFDMTKILKKIDFIKQDDEEWYTLQKHFDSVHSGFYETFQNAYPTLTETELRHCSLIKLHFSTKEVARYLNINPKSVQASRYRIKKKMQLEETIDLKKHIISFA